MATKSYIITVDRPDRVTDAEMRAYISDAVKAHGGAFPPDDPLRGMRDRLEAVRDHREPK